MTPEGKPVRKKMFYKLFVYTRTLFKPQKSIKVSIFFF